MSDPKEERRKRSKHDGDDDDNRREKRSKRARSRSKSPVAARDREPRRKRKHSKSLSPEKRVKEEPYRDDTSKDSEVKKEAPERKRKETDMLNTRTGGAYIPPARLRMMQAQITDKSSIAYQRLAWEALKKSIHGHINKINVGNIGIIIKELLKENIVRGRGLLCRSVIQAQAASPTFTNVYAALVAAVNSRFPNIGELLLKRLVIQFKRGFKRNDKPICISSVSFIAHLVNQRVAHEIIALELLTLLVETPTDDSVEVAIAFLKECGQKLTEVSSKGVNAIFEMLRNILHEGQLDKRVQYMIEVMFQVWKDGFKDHPAVVEELELVPEEEQFTHLLMLDDATDSQDILNVFKFDEKYEENEQKYKTLSKEILGSDAESEEDGSGESGSEESDDEEEEGGETTEKMTIIDNTETNLVALRRTIYLTINSSLDFEECAHKLMKMQLKPGQEVELCHMFLDCCAEQRTYEKFYGLLAQRFCNINRIYIEPFEEIFRDSYSTAHRLDTNRLRNVSKFFAHLLFTDSIGWEVLECVKLNEEDTTSSSRIYIKILFQELAEYMGLKKLNDRLKDPTLQDAFRGVFPRDNPKNTRFSINFFTSIGLGGLTDELREHLKVMPKNVPAPVSDIQVESGSSSDSSSSSSSSSSSDSSSSDSDEESSKKKKTKKKKSGEKSKEKAPKTPEEEPPKNTERWGHDGFYDTYGKDARRLENNSRPGSDVFKKPWDKRDDRRRDERNGDDRNREREDRDRRERGDRSDDDRSRREDRARDDNRSRREDNRSGRDEGRPRREEGRSKTDEDRFRREEVRPGNDDKSGRYESRSKNDDRYERGEGISRDDDRSGRDAGRSRREEESSRIDDDRSRREEDRSRDSDKHGRDDDNRSGRAEGRSRKDERSRTDDDRYKREEGRFKDIERSVTLEGRSRDDTRSRREEERLRIEEDRNRREEDKSRSDSDRNRRDQGKTRTEDKRTKREERSEIDSDRSKREDKSRKDGDKSRKDQRQDESSRDERYKTDSERSKKDDRSRKEDRSKKNYDDSSSDDERSKKHNRSNKEDRSKKDHNDSSSNDERSKRKEEKRKEKKKNKSSRRDDSDSSDDDRSRKGKKQDKERYQDDGWDIRRGSSIRREIAVGRYWDGA